MNGPPVEEAKPEAEPQLEEQVSQIIEGPSVVYADESSPPMKVEELTTLTPEQIFQHLTLAMKRGVL